MSVNPITYKVYVKQDKGDEISSKCPTIVLSTPLDRSLHTNFISIISFRFVQVQLTLATFKDLQKHPAHFSILITSTTTIHGITQLIRTHLYEAVRTIAIFKEPSCSKESYLNPSWSLESCGIEGSSVKYEPTRYQLYYDYIPDFLDCPILMADNEMRHIPLKCLK